jgi:hypothetical protein
MRFKAVFVVANILASSNAAPLDSYIICYTNVTTTFNIFFTANVYIRGPRLLLLLSCPSERRLEGHPRSGEVGREDPSRCSPGYPLRLTFLRILLRVSATPVIGGMGVFSIRQPTVAACWDGRCIPFLGALLVQVTAPEPQAAGRLLAVCPEVAELLAVMALRKTILSSVCLYPYCE